MIDHAKRLREIYGWLADPTDFAMVERTASEAAEEIDRLRARVAELEARLAARPDPPAAPPAAPEPPPPLFARELATYERLRPVLLTYAEGQYAVILGDTCHAVERTYEAALRVAYDGLGPVPFLVKQVLAEPELVRGMRPS